MQDRKVEDRKDVNRRRVRVTTFAKMFGKGFLGYTVTGPSGGGLYINKALGYTVIWFSSTFSVWGF